MVYVFSRLLLCHFNLCIHATWFIDMYVSFMHGHIPSMHPKQMKVKIGILIALYTEHAVLKKTQTLFHCAL
jgi:hypothetical protein